MFRRVFTLGFDEQRLRALLAVFFLALAIPTGFLIWQAYSQLKWEAFHQYRGGAEELTERMDARLLDLLQAAEARSFADYTFLVVSGDPSANLLQQSPLARYPVAMDLPGLLGYFQVGTAGEFSTPLLPEGDNPPQFYGIAGAEYALRQTLAEELQEILRDNRLVVHRVDDRRASAALLAAQEEADTAMDIAAMDIAAMDIAAMDIAAMDIAAMEIAAVEAEPELKDERSAAVAPGSVASSQQAFDELRQSRALDYDIAGNDRAVAGVAEQRQYSNKLGRVGDLQLDQAYQKKSVDREQEQQSLAKNKRPEYPTRVSRKEQISLAEPVAQVAGGRDDAFAERSRVLITTFESELDPLEFSLLDSGHFVLFRKVWREGERYIQGMLIEQPGFLEDAFAQQFRETSLAGMSNLIVAYQDQVLYRLNGDSRDYAAGSAGVLEGALLYRSRLSAPFTSLELIYSVRQLPPGPGAGVLGWVSLVLGLVLCTGFYALYRMALSQINLARQQQDFVSAVSHELKTPLTSIRMYGEMLKEGWASEEKKQQYYEFIHDESERLTRLISNVLQLASISRNEPQLDSKPVGVGELMQACESKIASQVQQADFELEFNCDPDCEATMICVDQDCFTQIIINLVDNAIKFSRDAQRKRIEVSAGPSIQDTVLFTVRDFGPGIPRDQMRKIFDMFYRTESELTRETIGTGIGLAIVQQLCSAMQARVDVLNRDPGAEFRVTVAVTNS